MLKNKSPYLPQAVFFDCDGVLADNEKEGHQVAFNEAFRCFNLPVFWDDERYAKLIHIGGGKERLLHFFEENGWPQIAIDKDEFVKKLHLKKTELYTRLIEAEKIKMRPGIKEFIDQLIENKIPYAICSTSKEEAVHALVNKTFDARSLKHLRFILAGDMVRKKKPHPDIYLLAAEKLGINPKKCLVLEDSETGLLAAKAAEMKVLITKSFYARFQNFSEADLILDSLQEVKTGTLNLEKIASKIFSEK